MKDIQNEFTYKGNTYKIVFNFNVMEQIQEEYGTLEKWGELTGADEPNAKAVIFGIWCMVNEGIDIANEEEGTDIKPLSKKQVGRMITDIGLDNASGLLTDTFVDSTQSTEKNE